MLAVNKCLLSQRLCGSYFDKSNKNRKKNTIFVSCPMTPWPSHRFLEFNSKFIAFLCWNFNGIFIEYFNRRRIRHGKLEMELFYSNFPNENRVFDETFMKPIWPLIEAKYKLKSNPITFNDFSSLQSSIKSMIFGQPPNTSHHQSSRSLIAPNALPHPSGSISLWY